jgi:hypothetical protein
MHSALDERSTKRIQASNDTTISGLEEMRTSVAPTTTRCWALSKEGDSYEHHVRVHARVDAAPVGVRNVMIFVAKVDAVVPGREYLDARPNLGGKVELSGAEHPPIETEEAPAACKKGLNSAVVKEIDLCTYWTPTATVGIHALAINLRLAYRRQWDHFGNIA